MSSAQQAKNGNASSDRDRELAELALNQAQQRPGSSTHGLPPAIPSDSIPGYDIIREIHRGGQGVVYQAIQKATKRKVAIKIVREGPFAGASERARFEREVQILGQLNHPNIVAIHDSGATGGSFYFVMDYISGQSLDAWVKANNPNIDQTLKIFGLICEAVSAAHLRGVIHRDLKPSNIRMDASGQPHILDFGLAKVAGEMGSASRVDLMTMTGQFIGSLPWASPEQAEGTPERIDIRTDVYSLGVVLYQLLTGRFPYEVVGNMRDVLDNILRAEPARPSTIRRQINNEVETIVLKCLSKDRERRYQSAGELARDIHRYLAGDPIEAKRDSGWYVITKTLRRYQPHVIVAAAFLVLLVVAGIAMAYLWREAQHQGAEARANAITARAESERATNYLQGLQAVAMTVLDADDVLKRLRGTTRVREAFAKTTPEALGLVRAQANDDPKYLRQLARGWEKYGDVLDGLFQAHTGDRAGAKRAYEESRAIRQRLLTEHGDQYESHADMAECEVRTAHMLVNERKYTEARGAYDRAIKHYDVAVGLAASASPIQIEAVRNRRAMALRDRGEAFLLQGETENGEPLERLMADARDACTTVEAYWEQRLADTVTDLAARELGICLDNKARIAMILGADAAEAAGKQLADPAQRAEAIKGTQAAVKQYMTAYEIGGLSLNRFEALYHQHPDNAQVRRDTFLAHHSMGYAQFQAELAYRKLAAATNDPADVAARDAHLEKAAAEFRGAVTIAEGLAAVDESNIEARRDLVIAENKLGRVLQEQGRLDEAEAIFARLLEVRHDLDSTDHTGQTTSDLAVGYYRCADLAEAKADQLATVPGPREASRDQYRKANEFFNQARALQLQARAEGAQISDSNVQEVFDRIKKVQEKIGKL